jgi:NAD(P)-dependent dehydrogenase (short-subunit alcohol dehydrogenase family)
MVVERPEPIRLDGEVVLVTGGGRGLGRAYALLLAQLGARVIVDDAGVDPDGSGSDAALAEGVAEEIIQSGGVAEASVLDISTRDRARAVVALAAQRFGRLDVLVHSAGLVDRSSIESVTEAGWSQARAVNIDAPLWLTQAALEVMRPAGYGRIVLSVSGHGFYVSQGAGLPAYAMGKAAQFGLMNALASECVGSGILVNAVSPVAATRIYTGVTRAGLEPERVAPGVAYLASRACTNTGTVLRAAGGHFSIGLYGGTPGVDLPPDAGIDDVATAWPAIMAGALKSAAG